MKLAPPVICRMGRTVTPGRVHAHQEDGDAGVLAYVRIGAAHRDAPGRDPRPRRSTPCAPSSTQWSPSRTALVRTAARSDPASVSENSWQASSSVRSMGRSQRPCCSVGAPDAGSRGRRAAASPGRSRCGAARRRPLPRRGRAARSTRAGPGPRNRLGQVERAPALRRTGCVPSPGCGRCARVPAPPSSSRTRRRSRSRCPTPRRRCAGRATVPSHCRAAARNSLGFRDTAHVSSSTVRSARTPFSGTAPCRRSRRGRRTHG